MACSTDFNNYFVDLVAGMSVFSDLDVLPMFLKEETLSISISCEYFNHITIVLNLTSSLGVIFFQAIFTFDILEKVDSEVP